MNEISFELRKRSQQLHGNNVYEVILSVDGKPYPNELFDCIGVASTSQVDSAETYIFTCSCGAPGCAGYHVPAQVTKKETEVSWEVEDQLERVLGAGTLTFDRKKYEAACNRLIEEIRAEEQGGWHLSDLVDHCYLEEDTCVTPTPFGEIFDRCVAHHQRCERTLRTIEQAAPEHFSKTYDISYSAFVPERMEFTILVQSVLNEFSPEKGEAFYLAKLKYAATALVDLIENGKFARLSRILESQWRKSGLTSGDFFNIHCERPVESVDWTKVAIDEAA